MKSDGDLMGDLSRALALRRKGISGKMDGADSGTSRPSADFGGALSKIADMIPPPPQPTHEAKEKTAERDDWED